MRPTAVHPWARALPALPADRLRALGLGERVGNVALERWLWNEAIEAGPRAPLGSLRQVGARADAVHERRPLRPGRYLVALSRFDSVAAHAAYRRDVAASPAANKARAEAMGIPELRVIGTGLDPVIAGREQWDDGNNTLALAPGVVVAYERNAQTNARLEDSGIEVLRLAASELATGRGGPRGMSCPIARDALLSPPGR